MLGLGRERGGLESDWYYLGTSLAHGETRTLPRMGEAAWTTKPIRGCPRVRRRMAVLVLHHWARGAIGNSGCGEALAPQRRSRGYDCLVGSACVHLCLLPRPWSFSPFVEGQNKTPYCITRRRGQANAWPRWLGWGGFWKRLQLDKYYTSLVRPQAPVAQ